MCFKQALIYPEPAHYNGHRTIAFAGGVKQTTKGNGQQTGTGMSLLFLIHDNNLLGRMILAMHTYTHTRTNK